MGWKTKFIMDITVKVMKGSNPFKMFREWLFEALNFIQEYGEDPTVAFLPKQDCLQSKLKPPILSIMEFPKVHCQLRLFYFVFKHVYLFSDVKNDSGRQIKFSTWMGFNSDPDHYLVEMNGDLESLYCTFAKNQLQALELENAVVFWVAPQFMCRDDAKKIIDHHLQVADKERLEQDPSEFLPEIYGQPWPSYSLNSRSHMNVPNQGNGFDLLLSVQRFI
jgi:hypothetical protein